jgi:NodT family efflux transporter outer membrane factor (OMF) lipoprotein
MLLKYYFAGFRYFCYSLLYLNLLACTTLGPNFSTPETNVSEKWLEGDHPNIDSRSIDHREWWHAFNDDALNQLINLAYEQNLPLQIAGVRIFEARAQLGIATGNRYPQKQQVSVGATYNSLSRSRANTFDNAVFSQDFSYWNYDVGFNASWEIDLWGKFKRGIQSADANLLAEMATYDNFLISLIAQVADAYIVIRTLENRIVLAKNNVQFQERSLHIADVRFRNGATTELDMQQARALLKNTQALIPRLEIGLRQAKNALSVLLGLPPDNLQEYLSTKLGDIPEIQATIAVGIPAELLRRRPDVKQAELRAASQSALIGVAKADLYPSFSLFGTLGFVASDGTSVTSTGKDGIDQLFKNDSLEFIGGPSFTWNLFNYGRIKNSVRVQDARYQQLILNYQETVLRAAQEVEDAMVGLLRSKEEVEFLNDSVIASERSVELALLQYRDGVSDYTRVLNTQEFLVTQEDVLTATKGNVARNAIAMYRALGGGWQIRENNDYLRDEIKQEMRKRTNWGSLIPE